ncbi:MAG: pseudouridine synthase [Thermomicrobiales bacterium]
MAFVASEERLQKVMAAAGVASRRASEKLIAEGRVRVNGQIVRELGTKVDPDADRVEVDGQPIRSERPRYIIFNKPGGYITTLSDERGRRTVADLIDLPERVVPVGRLDRPTQGLLLLTNDGALANRVMHPRYSIDKEYLVLVDGFPPPEVIWNLREGVLLDGKRSIPEEVRPMRETEDGLLLKVVIQEGRNRIVRRMFEAVNYPVLRLVRTRVGPIQLGNLPQGAWRDLNEGELAQLREAVGLDGEEREERPTRPDPRRQNTGRRPGRRRR